MFLYGYKAADKKDLAQKFNFSLRLIDDGLSYNISKISDFIDFVYSDELEIKDTNLSSSSISY